MPTKKHSSQQPDELRPEYDLATLGPAVRGQYFERASAGTNLVLLDPDLVTAFPTSESVNHALRMLVEVAEATSHQKKTQSGRKR